MTVPPFQSGRAGVEELRQLASMYKATVTILGYPTIQSPVRKMHGGVLTFREPSGPQLLFRV